ncbi:MAG: IclR family transcriptional regulator [Candidimonas sp.]
MPDTSASVSEKEQSGKRKGSGSRSASAGSQTIQRAFDLLRIVAEAGPNGMRLTEIAARANLHVATAHRLLGALVQERAVTFDSYSFVYHIGYDFLRRAEKTRDQALKQHFGGLVESLAAMTREMIYLYTRQSFDALCIDSARGVNSRRELTLGIGGRRPLGIGAGSIVLLASLPAKELARTLSFNEERYRRYSGITVKQIREMLREYWQEGYAFHPGYVMHGVSGLGIPLHGTHGEVVAAISVAAENNRMMPARRAELARIMRIEAARVGPFPVEGYGS